MSSKNVVLKSLMFKYIERVLYQGIAFVVQIIIARLLSPSDYGTLALLTVFITLSQIFVQSGLNTALIQHKDIEESDYSSVFWISLAIAGVMYIILFISAPAISRFYNMPLLKDVLRVLALVLIPGAYNSIQNAKISRKMKFNQLMYCTVIATTISGIVGVLMSYMGFGVWSLVIQQLVYQVSVTLVMSIIVKWHPAFVLKMNRVKILFSFGWKLLCSNLINALYNEMQSLIIGKKFTSSTLGFYNRGKQFPQLVVENINGSIQSVMLPVLSSEQENDSRMKSIMRRSIVTSSFIVFPLMVGLALTAKPIISLLLTDKWLPCVPYLQVFCIIYGFMPIHTANLQAINAKGRSDWFLKLELMKKSVGCVVLFITVVFFKSPMAIVVGTAIVTVISSFINAYPNKSILNYSYIEQMKDILPSLGISAIMGIAVYLVGLLKYSNIVILALQIVVGIVVYIALATLFKLECFSYIKKEVKSHLKFGRKK